MIGAHFWDLEVQMNDVEIESLLEDAGYQFDPVAGQYLSISSEDEAYNSEDVADTLEIPLEDLMRWEEEQRQADETAER
jgi:hypothetical protein